MVRPSASICVAVILACVHSGEGDSTLFDAEEQAPPRWLLSSRFREDVDERRLGTCDTIGNSGWSCDGTTRSIYCRCEWKRDDRRLSKMSKKLKSKSKWDCDKHGEETCTVGSPACVYGRCKDESTACGVNWATALATQTCSQLFTAANDTSSCQAVFGTSAICPVTVLPAAYTSWMNKMKDATIVKDMLTAAALDTMWFYDKLKSMVEGWNETANTSDASLIPAALTTTDITMHFEKFQKFSCLRNVPECLNDNVATTNCENACYEVDAAIAAWLVKCKASQTSGVVQCGTLGYVRDCNGTAGASAGDWPGLCTAFQNQPVSGQVNGALRAASVSLLLLLPTVLMFV